MFCTFLRRRCSNSKRLRCTCARNVVLWLKVERALRDKMTCTDIGIDGQDEMITDPFVECLQQRAEPCCPVGRIRHGGHPAELEDQ